jgi:UMF1 family MFS transporter
LSAPLAAAVMLLGAIPFFLWTPDAARTGATMLDGLRHGADRAGATPSAT